MLALRFCAESDGSEANAEWDPGMMGVGVGFADSLTVGLILGFKEQTCVSNNEKPVVQLPVMSLFPLQCASTSV